MGREARPEVGVFPFGVHKKAQKTAQGRKFLYFEKQIFQTNFVKRTLPKYLKRKFLPRHQDKSWRRRVVKANQNTGAEEGEGWGLRGKQF